MLKAIRGVFVSSAVFEGTRDIRDLNHHITAQGRWDSCSLGVFRQVDVC